MSAVGIGRRLHVLNPRTARGFGPRASDLLCLIVGCRGGCLSNAMSLTRGDMYSLGRLFLDFGQVLQSFFRLLAPTSRICEPNCLTCDPGGTAD